MSAAITDLLTQVGQPGTVTSLSSPGKALGASSINVGSTANWPTGTAVFFAMRQIDPSLVSLTNPSGLVAGTYTEWKAVVASGTIINNLTLQFGTDQVYPAGSNTQVFVVVSAARENSIVTWGIAQHNQDGSHHDITTNAITATNGTFTNLTITGSNTSAGWNPLGSTLTFSANNGNKEFVCGTSSDLTGTLTPGMRLQVTRNTVPSTQCMAFAAASSQYATKASPSGITFTAAFTCEAWVYLNSYTGLTQAIISRTDNSTGGFMLYLNAAGQPIVQYNTTSAFTQFQALQSIPLNQWVHIAGVVTSVASKTGAVYINGISVPVTSPTATATALTQVGNLTIGAFNAGIATTFLNGYVSEARVWSVAQSQANILANMAINLTGSETNLVALYKDAVGTFVDSTSNANTLTANGGAIATQVANPFGSIEYAIITKVTSSQITVYTGNVCTIPNMTLSNPQYSTVKAPYGFPGAETNWRVDVIYRVAATGSVTSSTYINALSANISVPTGPWKLWYAGSLMSNTTNAVAYAILATAAATATGILPRTWTELYSSAGSTFGKAYADDVYVAAAQTLLYANLGGNSTMTVGWDLNSAVGVSLYITAQCAYA